MGGNDGARRFMTRDSQFGEFAIVWNETGERASVLRILLPGPGLRESIARRYTDAQAGSHPAVFRLAGDIEAAMSGEPVSFSLDRVALNL